MSNALKTLFTNCANAIRETLPDVGKMSPNSFPDRIREVAQAGGGSSDLVKYVTFMSWDGLIEYGKKPTISGDDCLNPISIGLFETPTKESTNTENFAFSGWSLTSGGSANSSTLKNITEDVIVYASFTASVRYYTVNFYDGNTLKKTIEVTYGSDASKLYVPEKDGYLFIGWTVDVSNVTSDISTVAIWEEDSDVITDSWETINANCYSNNHSRYTVGKTKTDTITYNGTTWEVEYLIIGKNHDDLADGSGKARLTWRLNSFYPSGTINYNGNSSAGNGYTTTNVCNALNGGWIYTSLSAELRSVIKEVTKYCDTGYSGKQLTTKNLKAWWFSTEELGLTISSGKYVAGQGEVYEYFTDNTSRKMCTHNTTTAKEYLTRTAMIQNSNKMFFVVSSDGSNTGDYGNSISGSGYITFGFCI